MNFVAIMAACQGFLPKHIVRANRIKCAACQGGKAHIASASKIGKIIGGFITKPGDLIHMDQGQSSITGRPHTFSGNNNKK